jgi:hypothetical protein
MKKLRSKHNNLLNYFICDKRDLSPAYVASCEKFFKEISRKHQASSSKRQAAGSRRDPDFLKKDKKRFDSYKLL